MAGLEDPDVVDVVGEDATGVVLVIMVESRRWGADADQPSQFKNKVNAYVGFILDGGLRQHFPDFADKPVAIQLDCAEAPTGEIASLVQQTGPLLAELGIGFRVNVWKPQN